LYWKYTTGGEGRWFAEPLFGMVTFTPGGAGEKGEKKLQRQKLAHLPNLAAAMNYPLTPSP
jgi:hypothetical protein